jgi:hypothetical protein
VKLRSKRVLLLIIGVVAAAAIALVGIALAGGDGTAVSKADYQAKVVNARDRVDFALEQVTKVESLDEFLERMDEGAALTKDVAGDLGGVNVPDRYEKEHETLVKQLRQLAADLQGTADQVRTPGFEDVLTGAQGLNFESWDVINTVLGELRKKGIDVQPLARH